MIQELVAITFSSQNHENVFYNIFILKSCCCSFSPGACPEHCERLWGKFCDENMITTFVSKNHDFVTKT